MKHVWVELADARLANGDGFGRMEVVGDSRCVREECLDSSDILARRHGARRQTGSAEGVLLCRRCSVEAVLEDTHSTPEGIHVRHASTNSDHVAVHAADWSWQ